MAGSAAGPGFGGFPPPFWASPLLTSSKSVITIKVPFFIVPFLPFV
jgi:hypothetical protein